MSSSSIGKAASVVTFGASDLIVKPLEAAGDVLSDVSGMSAAKDAAKAQTAALKEQRIAAQRQANLDRLAEARERTQSLRQTQIQRARAVTSAAAQGALSSSSAQGGIGSIGTQGAENIGFSQQVSSIQSGIGASLDRASAFQQQYLNKSSQAQTQGQLFNLGLQAFGAF